MKKLQNLEKENSLLKEQVTKKDKTKNVRSEEKLVDKNKKGKEGRKQKFDEKGTESTEESRSRTVDSRKTLQRPKRSVWKTEEKKKIVN